MRRLAIGAVGSSMRTDAEAGIPLEKVAIQRDGSRVSEELVARNPPDTGNLQTQRWCCRSTRADRLVQNTTLAAAMPNINCENTCDRPRNPRSAEGLTDLSGTIMVSP